MIVTLGKLTFTYQSAPRVAIILLLLFPRQELQSFYSESPRYSRAKSCNHSFQLDVRRRGNHFVSKHLFSTSVLEYCKAFALSNTMTADNPSYQYDLLEGHAMVVQNPEDRRTRRFLYTALAISSLVNILFIVKWFVSISEETHLPNLSRSSYGKSNFAS